MNKISIIIATVVLLLTGCTKEDYNKSESGLVYKYITKADGRKPLSGEVVEMNLSYKTEEGKVLFSTEEAGGPVPILYQEDRFSKNGSLEEVFLMITEGDSIVFKIPAGKVFEETFNQPVPDSIEKTSSIIFNLGVTRILSTHDYRSEQAVDYMQNAKSQYILSSEQIEKDGKIIDAYLSTNNLLAQKTETGIRYIINNEGEGDNAQPGDKVSVNYTGRVMDGRVFDTSFKEIAEKNNQYNPAREPYGPYQFTLGLGEVIYGWDEGISLLKKGGKATLFIPSALGYGPRAMSDVIAENSILIFDVELVDIVKD